MTNVVLGEVVGSWVMRHMEGSAVFTPQSMTAIGCERDGKLIAGFVFENWNGQSMMAHMAIQGRASREFFRFAADYAFRQCGIYKLIAPIDAHNNGSIHLVQKIGFRYECRIADANPHGDICIFTLVEEDCRFLKGRYGQKCCAASA
jgi:RimJ/RimL family protein N-acetyltransferase